MNLTESSGSDDHNHHVGGARTALALTARWRRAQAMLGAVVTASALAGSMVAGAATTTFGVLLDTDNNINSGCTISTADGSFAGVELVLNTTVVANSTGYRVTGITLQSCTGSSLSAPVTLDSAAYPVARGFGANGTSAVETYIPTAYLPQSGLKMRIGLTTSGADGITGADALLSSNGAAILFDAPPPLVVPALSTMALGLTALLLALAVWYARRRGWHGMQLVVVAVFAISLSGQIIAAIVRDGLITDWSGVSALATDPLGDAPAGTDVSALYATYDGPNLYFRIDAALNSPPVANPQSVTAKVGETLNITLTGSDYEGATLSYAVLVPPTQGVLGGTAPNVTYTPNANATASDSFTFKVNDGTLDSATATVSITNTRAPQITSANSAIFIPTQANSFTFASNGMPTPTAAFGGCTPALPSVTFVADANGGGTLSGSPLVSEAGPHTCTFTSTNGVTPNATQSFTLTVGGAPTITSAATVSVPELAPFTHTVTTTSVGLPITGMAQPTGTLPSAVTFTYAGTPAATATVGGTPAVCTRGTYPISLTASNIVGTTTQNFTLTVRPVNQAPSFTAGATVTVNEDSGPQTVAGWATALNKGAPCESAQVLTFEITGNTNSALFSTQPAVNGTNGNLTFTPAPNANGTATITLRVRDDGGVVDGGVDVSATQNFVINVTPVNDAPVLTAGATLAYTENGPAAVIDNTITITDIDSANLVGATVVISGNYQNGQDVLAFVNASGITGNFVAGTGTLTLTGSSSLANYQTALRSVTYVNTSDNPSALTRTVSWTVDDGGATANLSNTATSSINVTPVNDAPVVVAGNTVTYTENSPAIALSPGLTANDVDSANLTATTVQITGNYFNGQDVLSFVNAGGITGVFSVATGTMTLTGSASVATWQTALRSVAYVNTSENPSTLARTVTWIVNDGAALSLPVTSTVNVVAVNDAPVLTAGATLAFTEGGSAAVVDGTVTVSDVDSVNLTSATVQITANYANGEDVLAFVNAGGITGSFAPATGTLTLTGVATLANYQAALRSVTYNNTSITPSTLARTVTWIGNDGALPSAPVTSTINVIAVNSPPTINSVAPATATEGALYTYGATRIDADGPGQTWSLLGTNTCAGAAIVPATGVYTFTPAGPVPPASCVVAIQVCDGGTPNLCATQTTTVTITPVNDAPVINSTAPTPATEDVAYTYNATRLDPDGPGQTWSLTASNTCAGASIVAGTGVYTYTPVGPTPPASCVIGIQVCDGGTPNLCATQTTTLNITAVNDAPVINSAAPTTATEDTLYTYTATRVDPDGPAQAWSIAGTNTCAGASIVAGTGVYTFTPAGPIPPASCDVGIQVCDNGTPNLCATQTTTVTIIAVNDPPIPTNPGTLAARVHIPVTFPAATLGGTDPDLGVVTIDTVPTSVLAGATVTINADGSFTFSPPAEATGTVVGFAYRVCDNGNPGPGVCSAYQNVSFNLTGPTIYYVKTAAVGSGNCTLTNECTLATALTNIGALTGRTIFISDSAIYTQAVTLNSGGSLYGQGVTGASFDAVFGTSVPPVGAIPARPAINATRPFITSTGVTVALNSNNTVRGLNLTGTAGPTVSGNNFGTLTASDLSITGGLPALSLINGAAAATFDAVSSTGGATGVLLNAVTGTLNINGGAISGATATGFSVIGGTATINNAATVTSGAGARSISVTGKTSGTATFSGAVTDNGTGISLTSNTGGTINFTGVITASTGGNTAFNATGGGTVAATNTASTLTSTTGTALNVTNTTIGAGNLVFRSISVNGATTGINLSSTGSSGGLTVLGNSAGNCGGSVVDKNTVATAPVTADCTGGTIQNAATGIRLDNTANVSLTRMRITGNATHNFGIYATNTTNFSLNRSVIDGTIGVTTGGQDAPLVFGKLDVVGDPGINGLSGTANAITDSWIQGGIEHNVEIYGQSNNFGLAVTRTVVKSNSVGGGADGIQMELQGTAVGRVLVDNSQFDDNKSQAIQAAANGSSTVHFTLQNSRWSKTTQGNEGVVFSNGSNGQLFVDINNNLVPGTPAAGFGGAAIFVGQTPGNATASSRLHATVRNNTVTTPTTATNHTLIAYPTSTVGAGAPGFVRFENNTVTNHGLFNGIIVNTPDAGTNPNFHATVLNNNITHTDSVNAVNPIAINARQSSTACLHIANNAATVPPSTGFVGVRARQVAPALVTLYDVPPAGTTAAFELAANHPTATTEVIGTITLTGVICTSPTAPSAP
ncbi:beta strand repeat-containing protein [Casimicrobium huifangae]|uniref:beta strand repeat-containing protein n=1 Tax=Casimicrobium huifangae TaxID=2591109 RepID=UPI00378515C3